MFDFIPNTYFLFAFGLILLIKGGDWFVDAATSIAHRFGLPELLIGATVVSIGTTLPEVMTSAIAAMGGSGEIAYGNAIGSIICNTSLIAALTIAIKPGKADKRSMLFPVACFFSVAVFYALNAYIAGEFKLWAGIVLIACFVVYMTITVINMKRGSAQEPVAEALTENAVEDRPATEESGSKLSLVKDILVLLGSAIVIALGAHLLVNSATEIAESLGIPESVIALTVVALGTSLPELVTAITSLMKGHGALSLGNIIGANIFNLVLVSGVAITINPFTVPMTSSLFGANTSLVLDVPVMFAVMALLTVPTLLRGRLARWQGISLLAIYAAFLVMQFVFVVPV